MGGPTTVFVRNLPYTCDDAGLEAAFGEIGPVKECFIIADKGSGGRSKGFGFVQFALAEDAAAAVARSKTFKVDGRPVTIDVAKQKPSSRGARSGKEAPADATGGGGGERARDDDGDDSDSDAPKIRSAPEPRNHDAFRASGANANPGGPRRPGGRGAVRPAHPALEDARAARTVALAGLRLAGEPGGIDPDAALDAARACGDVEEIISPAPNDVIGAAKLRHDGAARGGVCGVRRRGDCGVGGGRAPSHLARRGETKGAARARAARGRGRCGGGRGQGGKERAGGA